VFYFSLAVFLIGLIGTPFYYRQMAANNEPWKVHALIATVAFAIWAYAAQGGVYSQAGLYSAAIAGFLVRFRGLARPYRSWHLSACIGYS
jgi:hypothetical protein